MNSGGLGIYRQLMALGRLSVRAYRPYAREIALLTFLGFVGGILEGIGINAVIPLLTFVLGLQNPATDTLSQMIQHVFVFVHVPFVPKFLLSFIVILFMGKALVTLILSYIQIDITTEYERDTRSRLFSMIMRASWPYLLHQKIGNLETAIMIDAPNANALLTKLSSAITLVTGLIMYLIVAFSISPLVTFATFLIGLLALVILRPLLNRVHQTSAIRVVSYRDTLHHVSQHVMGLKTVKAYDVSEAAIERSESLFLLIKNLSVRIQRAQQLAAQAIAPLGVIYIAAILSIAFKTSFLSLAAMPAILYLIYRIFTYVQQLQTVIQYMSELAPHLERVVALEDAAGNWREEAHGGKPFVYEKELTFDSVSFRYEQGGDVLKGVSLCVPKGAMIGIVGPSGAGKTTCVDLILRLLEPTSGAIRLDGIDSSQIDLSQWRRNVAYVSQDFFLLNDTIRNNIAFYDPTITDQAIMDAARLAHIDELIERSPKGLDTMVGDRGMSLSAGERQRITIARALARKPELLILDEATSALDRESEAKIKETIEAIKGRVTIIAIAHRLSTIMDSDRLLVLNEGSIVESESPQKLLQDPTSYFYRVYSIDQ